MTRFVSLGASALVLLMSAGLRAQRTSENDTRNSVVKIFATQRWPNGLQPWNKQPPQEITGSGVVIDGQRILTNAHVVLYAGQIFVQAYQSGDKTPAKVEGVAPGIDLAVLKLGDESFFEKRPPLKMAFQLPAVKDEVSVYGYPFGGTSLSITKGIISRIEVDAYYYEEVGLRIQIDAAINPGNSGGPAVVDDQMVGVAFSHFVQGQNIGYVIPIEEIQMFLQDIADGTYDGKPRIFDELQTLENDALRAKLGLDKTTTGILVHAPYSSDPSYPLKEWDLITRIGDYDIDNEGMVRVKENLRLQFHYLVPKLATENKVRLSIVREGKPLVIDLPVTRERNALLRYLKGRYPSYFVYGPLVFSTATADYVDQMGPVWSAYWSSRGCPLVTRRSDLVTFEGEQLVVVTAPLFPHKISKGYSDPSGQVLSHFNGVRIRNLRHLVETLRDTQERHLLFQMAGKFSETLVFDREELQAAMDDILADNGIREQCSVDLREAWRPKK